MPRLFTLLQRFALARRCTNILFPNQPGWYRIATMPNVNSWTMLMSICKGYNTNGSNSALVALAGQYNTGRIQVLMPARTNATGIKQLRILYKPESPIIIDGYYDDDSAGYSNSISFVTIGGVHIYYTPYIADINFETDATPATIPSGYTAITADLTVGGGYSISVSSRKRWRHENIHDPHAARQPNKNRIPKHTDRAVPYTVGINNISDGIPGCRILLLDRHTGFSHSFFRDSPCVAAGQFGRGLFEHKLRELNFNYRNDHKAQRHEACNNKHTSALACYRSCMITKGVAV